MLEFRGTSSQIYLINQAAEEAYTKVYYWLQKNPAFQQVPLDKIHYSGCCVDTTTYLLENMRELGFIGRIAQTLNKKGYERRNYHEFPVLNEEWVIDGAWQGFLGRPNPYLPKVLIARFADLSVILKEYGVRKRLIEQFWFRTTVLDYFSEND